MPRPCLRLLCEVRSGRMVLFKIEVLFATVSNMLVSVLSRNVFVLLPSGLVLVLSLPAVSGFARLSGKCLLFRRLRGIWTRVT